MGQHSQKSPLSLSTWADRLDLQFLEFSPSLTPKQSTRDGKYDSLQHSTTEQRRQRTAQTHPTTKQQQWKGVFSIIHIWLFLGVPFSPSLGLSPFFPSVLCLWVSSFFFSFVCSVPSHLFFFGFSSFVEGAVLFWYFHVKLSNKKTALAKKTKYLQQTHRRMERRSGGRTEWRKDGGARKQASEQTEWLTFGRQEVPHKNRNPKIITRWKSCSAKKDQRLPEFSIDTHTHAHTPEAPPQHNCHQHQNNLILVKQKWRTNTCNNTIIKPTNT